MINATRQQLEQLDLHSAFCEELKCIITSSKPISLVCFRARGWCEGTSGVSLLHSRDALLKECLHHDRVTASVDRLHYLIDEGVDCARVAILDL